MKTGLWFSRLRLVHTVQGRVRWRYVCAVGAPGCAKGLQLAAENLPGVLRARVNTIVRSLIVRFDPQQTSVAELERRLRALPAPLVTPVARRIARGRPPSVVGVAASLANLLGSVLLPPPIRTIVALAAALPVFRHALVDLFSRGITSHVLEGTAVLISLARRDLLAANVTTFMLALGEYLEDSIAQRSDELLKRLLRPVGDEVWLERDGVELLVPLSTVQVGDTVVVGTGTIIPVDGTILGGVASINEAAMTGESQPVRKERGDRVLSGTHVEEGRLRIYAEQVGPRTAAARIADYVEQSLIAKSEAQLQAARLADRLVPLVLGLAGTTWIATGGWQRAAAVLQADYSCVLKLATPVAFKSCMYRAGRNGILVKGASALERLADADTFVFDKTGTLTAGKMIVTDSIAFDPSFTTEDLVCLAASVEEHYFHPLALAVVDAAHGTSQRHFEHSEVQFIAAHGVASAVNGKRIVVGSRHFVADDEGIDISPYIGKLDEMYHAGKMVLYIGFGGRLIGVLALKDRIRDNSAYTLGRLRALGATRIVMLTGDHKERAAELASRLGIDEWHAELLPEHKAEIISRMSKEGARIAFVGDGINDAPALAGAHVGIAMKQGAEIAQLSADIALLEDDIARVADAKALANATMKRIHSNYCTAVGLNTGILGAAALGRLRPITSALLHNGSTIGILLSALRAGEAVDSERQRPSESGPLSRRRRPPTSRTARSRWERVG